MTAQGFSRGIPRLAAYCLFLSITAFSSKQTFGETFDVPGDRARTIVQAIALADADLTTTNDVIEVATGTYVENLKVLNSLTIRGKLGAKVVVRAASSDPVIEIGGASSAVTIERLILTTPGFGVRITGTPSVIIRNLVITQASTGIQCNNAIAGSTIAQVTFFDVDVGINCIDSIMTIRNSIFSNVSVTPIASFIVTGFLQPLRNLFWNVPSDAGERGDEVRLEETVNDSLDPLFVETSKATEDNDFHLKEGSGGIGTGLESFDVGAYGGPISSNVPFPPAKPSVTCASLPALECTVSWTRNLDHNVVGYLVLSSAPSAPDPDYGATTPVDHSAGGCPVSSAPPPKCSLVVGPLPDSGTAPPPPSAPTARFGDSKVQLDWPAVSGATRYDVYVATDPSGIGSGTPYRRVSVPTATVENLINGTEYFFAVTAVNQPVFNAAVKSAYEPLSATATSGVSELSEPADPVAYGTARVSGPSPTVSATPQPVIGFPPLEDNGGCFIATAAYGSALAPQVDVLRAFREHYLRPYGPGRAMIRLYETLSPPLADAIRSSDASRLVVRAILWPVVGSAWIAVYGPWWVILMIAGAGATLVLLVLMRRRGDARA